MFTSHSRPLSGQEGGGQAVCVYRRETGRDMRGDRRGWLSCPLSLHRSCRGRLPAAERLRGLTKGCALLVGPLSAGANPGPARYEKGGEDPTMTDANLVLGRLNPWGLLVVIAVVFPKLAEIALSEKIAEPLGISPVRGSSTA